jgi:hypothetical protein
MTGCLWFCLAWVVAACAFGLIAGPLIGGTDNNE